jgi:NTP pyrophosphatase (non-canonical NTP hydrolase)
MTLKQLELLSQQKYEIQIEKYPERCSADMYIKELEKEIIEVKEEIKVNNVIHLQDELGDLFWDLL